MYKPQSGIQSEVAIKFGQFDIVVGARSRYIYFFVVDGEISDDPRTINNQLVKSEYRIRR